MKATTAGSVIVSPGAAIQPPAAAGKMHHLVIEARDTAKALTGPMDYILSANVTDSADQTMGKSTVVTAHKTQFYLGMHANEFVQAVGMPFGVNLVALDPDGKQKGTKAKLTMTRTVHSCLWEQMGARSFQRCESTPKKMFEREISIANAGSHTERIYPTEPGDYVIEISAKDSLGNEVKAASQIWVIGKGEAFWSGDEGARMTLVSGKPTYDVGDTARLVAQAYYDAREQLGFPMLNHIASEKPIPSPLMGEG